MNPHNFYSDVNIDGILLAKGVTINSAYSLPILDGPTNYVLTTDGLGNITFQDPNTLVGGTNYWNLVSPGDLQLDIAITGSVIPLITNNNDLGSDTNRWKDLFIGTSINLDSAATINSNIGTGYLSLSYFGTADYISLGVDGFNALNIYKDPIITGSYTSLVGENTLDLYSAYGRIGLKAYAAISLFGTGVDADIIITDGTLTQSHDNNTRLPIFIGSQNSTINVGLINTVVIGGTTLTASNSNTVYLGNNVNINNAYTLPNVDGTTGQILKTNGLGVVTWQADSGVVALDLVDLNDVSYPSGTPVDGDILTYNGNTNNWEPTPLPLSFSITASKNILSSNLYLNQDNTAMNVSPFILPFDCKLKYLSASTDGIGTWTAEVHVNGVLVPGATLNIVSTNKAKVKFFIPIQFNEDDEVMLYCNGIGVNKPRIIAFFG